MALLVNSFLESHNNSQLSFPESMHRVTLVRAYDRGAASPIALQSHVLLQWVIGLQSGPVCLRSGPYWSPNEIFGECKWTPGMKI